MYNEGISKVGDIIDLATTLEIISKRGAFFSYGDIRLGQGRENSKDFLRQNPELSNEIEAAIRQSAVSGAVPLIVGGSSGDEDAAAED
jgi:recombination protein RecA